MARTLLEPQGSSSGARGKLLTLVLVLGAVSVGAMVYRGCDDATPGETAPVASAAPSASVEGILTRCSALDRPPVVIGELAAPAPAEEAPDGGALDDDDPDEADMFAPFAVVLGRGAPTESGFAVGSLERIKNETAATVRRLGEDGTAVGTPARLARSSGNVEAPVVIGHGASLLVAFLEPNANGRDILVGKVEGDKTEWGPELDEGSDESLALDIAVASDRLAIVWDDLDKDDESRVMLALLDPKTLSELGEPRPVTGDDVAAEMPRLVPREGGFWLTYIARRPEAAGSVPKPPPEEREAPSKDDEVDERRGGEVLSQTWIEVVPLGPDGKPAGAARDVTPRDGHVLAYDVASGADGNLLVVWRDERSPVGGSGGSVSLRKISLGGLEEPQLVQEEDVETGVPQIVGDWLVVTPLRGAMLLAPLAPNGELAGPLLAEPAVGRAQPIAAKSGQLLVGTPAGTAMKLSVVTCRAD